MDDTGRKSPLKQAASGEDKKDAEAKAFFEKNKPSIKDAGNQTWDSLNEQAKELWRMRAEKSPHRTLSETLAAIARMRAENRQDESLPDFFTYDNTKAAEFWAEQNEIINKFIERESSGPSIKLALDELMRDVKRAGMAWPRDFADRLIAHARLMSDMQAQKAKKPRRKSGQDVLDKEMHRLKKKGVTAQEAWKQILTTAELPGGDLSVENNGTVICVHREGKDRRIKETSFPSIFSKVLTSIF